MHRFLPFFVALFGLAACGGANPDATTAPPPVVGPTIPQIIIPEETPTRGPTVGPGIQSTLPPTLAVGVDDAYLSLPFTITADEVAAVESGAARYTGYQCILAAGAGCSCDTPVLMAARFTLTQEGQMVYRYRGGGLDSQVVMTRIGDNQWDFNVPIYSEDQQEFLGGIKGLISFNNRGYTYTQVGEMLMQNVNDDQRLIRCPDVQFSRIEDVTPTPTE